MRESLANLEQLGFKNLEVINAFFGDKKPLSDDIEWRQPDEITSGPLTYLRGPFGYWALGRFGSGISLGILANCQGVVDERLYIVGVSGEFLGSLSIDDMGEDSIYSYEDEDELYDEFEGMPREGHRSSMFSAIDAELPPWELIRPVSYNNGVFEFQEHRENYEEILRKSLLKHNIEIDEIVTVCSFGFWKKLVEKSVDFPKSLGKAVIAENIIFLMENNITAACLRSEWVKFKETIDTDNIWFLTYMEKLVAES